ncbi:MAG: hypothetical protein IJY66_03475 [Clostridia bacterium]|nr:hypothetical protein [Clostridia bacterium]
MKRNEQLLRELSGISPLYIKEAQPGRVPAKKTMTYAPYGRFRALGVLAAMVVVAAMMFALGFSVSAAEPDPANEEYQIGTMLMDIPEVLTQDDFEWMVERVEAGVAAESEIDEFVRKHWLKRFQAFFALQNPNEQTSNKKKQEMMAFCPVSEVVSVYTVDINLTESERDYLYHFMVTYGEMTQLDLITMYQSLYDLVEQSDLSEERKQEIRDSLPALPEHSPSAPPANYLTAEAEAAGKRQMTPSALPFVLLPEDYAIIRDAVLAKYGAESIETLPPQAKRLLNNYTKYPLQSSNPDNYQIMVDQHFAKLTANEELYIIDPTLSIEERVMLCYGLAMEADVWGEDGARMAKNLYDTMEERYPGELDPTWGWVRDIIMPYWQNWIWVQDYAYVK